MLEIYICSCIDIWLLKFFPSTNPSNWYTDLVDMTIGISTEKKNGQKLSKTSEIVINLEIIAPKIKREKGKKIN